MAHTNETPNYHLPQYVGTDIINPLVDTNGAYSDIDTALKDIADAEVADAGAIDALEATVGDNTAGLVKDVADLQTQNGDSVLTTDAQTLSAAINEIDAHTDTNTGNIADNSSAITGLQNTVGNANSGLVKDVADNASAITGLQTTVGDNNSGLVKDVAGLQTTVGDADSGLVKGVADLQTQAGNSALTTTAQTLTGAINELDGDIASIPSVPISIKTLEGSVEVTSDGVKTVSELLDELHAAFIAAVANIGDDDVVEIEAYTGDMITGETTGRYASHRYLEKGDTMGTIAFMGCGSNGSNVTLWSIRCAASASTATRTDITDGAYPAVTIHTTDVPTSGKNGIIHYRVYTKNV